MTDIKVENLTGRFFLGTEPDKHINYVWGQVLQTLGDDTGGGKYVYGFFPWGVDVEPKAEFRAVLNSEQTAGYRYFSTVQELNQAVRELAHAHFVLDQYKVKPAKGKRGKKTAKRREKKDA
ncbi:MAG: hypothetical protein WA306_09370 [Candidatus Acidiferrales bacterium]